MTEVTRSLLGEVIVGYRDGVTVLSLTGEHDSSTAPELGAQIETHVERGFGVVVNLIETEFIDSAIIYTLVEADHLLLRKGRSLALCVDSNTAVDRLLELSGLLEMLPWSLSLDEAITLAGPAASDQTLRLRARSAQPLGPGVPGDRID